MTPNPKTGFISLPKVIMGNLAGKFGKISLYDQHADFEFGSSSNSNSTSPWVITCESATEPSCEDAPLHEHFPYGLCNASRAHAEALAAHQTGKEIVSDYSSDSNPASRYYSDSSYEFDFGSDHVEPESEVSVPLTAKSSWLLARHRDPQGPDPTGTSMTSQQTSCLAMHPPMKPMTKRTPDVNATRSKTNGVDVSVNLSQSRIS
jgi:hypothetical protein